MTENNKKLFSYNTLVHAVAGATGSVVAMGTFYPLDTVRSRLQLEENRKARNTFSMLQELTADEGFLTLYRGMVPVLESLCTSNFVYFYTFHGLKGLRSQPSQQSAGRDLLLASIAGVVNVLLTSPLWVVNTRLKMKGVSTGTRQHILPENVHYSGLTDGILKIARNEGIAALWSGSIPSLLLVLNPALHFMTYEALKRHLKKVYGSKEISGWIYFLLGAFSKAVSTILTYPLQLIQTKLRHGHNYKDLPVDAGMLTLAAYILKKDGIPGLYKGMESKILQTISTAALMFATYEKIAACVFKLLLSHQQISSKVKN